MLVLETGWVSCCKAQTGELIDEVRGAYTAGVEQTRVQARKSRARSWLFRSRLLWSTDGIRNRRRHRRRTRAQADELERLNIHAALPAPSIFVEALDLGIREAVRCAEG